MRFFIRLVLLLGGVLGLVGVGGLAFLAIRLPEIPNQLPQTPMIVTITAPLNGIVENVGAPTAVTAEAISENPIRLMELWADGILIEAVTLQDSETGSASASWTWSPSTEGEHFLLVRAIDNRAQIGQSNIVRVKASASLAAFLMTDHIVSEGETLEGLAQEFDTTPEDILEFNSGLDPTAPLPPGEEISIPVPLPAPELIPPSEEAPSPPTGPVSEAGGGPNKLIFWFTQLIAPTPVSPPIAPNLKAGVEGCDLRLVIGDGAADEAGFFLYRLAENGPGFLRIATLGSQSGTGQIQYRDEGLFGAYTYYAASFNSAGESPGNMIQVEVKDPTCNISEWSGIRLEGGKLELPQPVDIAYIYLSVNNGPWQRIPPDPVLYLTALAGNLDVTAFLSELPLTPPAGECISLALEAWGWRGGTLIDLGQGQGKICQKATAFLGGPWLWEWTKLNYCRACRSDVQTLWEELELSPVSIGEHEFKWSTGAASATAGLWQVSAFPFPPGPDPDPPGLIAEGLADKSGWFTIDFEPIIGKAMAAEQTAVPSPTTRQFTPIAPWELVPGQQVSVQPPLSEVLSLLRSRTLYLRVLPMAGTQVVGPPSNPVQIRYTGELPESPFVDFPLPVGPLYEARITKFDPPIFPDPTRWGCVVITANNLPADAPFGPNSWPVGLEFCPKPFQGASQGTFFDKLWESVKALVNLVSMSYDFLKQRIVDVLLNYGPLGLQCKAAAELAGEALPEGLCRQAFAVAVDAGLVALGLPPSLPNFDQLAQVGKGHIVDLAVELAAKQLPFPCDSICKEGLREVISQGLDEGIEALNNTSVQPGCMSEAEAHQHGREPLCLPQATWEISPGVTQWVVKPATGAVYVPPLITIELRRNATVPDPEEKFYPSCSLSLNMHINNFFPGGTVYGPYSPTGSTSMEVPAQVVEGDLYHPINIPLPRMQPGEVRTVVLAFDQIQNFTFSWTEELYKQSQIPPDSYQGEDWLTLHSGGTATISTSSLAAFPGAFIPLQQYTCVVPDQETQQLPNL